MKENKLGYTGGFGVGGRKGKGEIRLLYYYFKKELQKKNEKDVHIYRVPYHVLVACFLIIFSMKEYICLKKYPY